jgi:hypothetical protein
MRVVCIVTRLWAGIPRNSGSIPGRGKRFIISVQRADRLSVPYFRLFCGYWSIFSPRQNGRLAKLTTHPHLVSRLRMSGAIPPLPYMPLWLAQQIYLVYVCACVLRDKPYLDFKTFESWLGPRDLFCNVYVILKAHCRKFRSFCSGNRFRDVAE